MTSPRRGSATPWPASSTPAPAVASVSDAYPARARLPRTPGSEPPPAVPRRGRWHATLALARPRQWVKNALVIAAPGAAGALGHDDVPARVAVACLAFCLISSGIYALNDSRDADEDRCHPRKRLRPVAAGELAVRDAVLLGAGWLLVGLALCFSVRTLLGAVGLGYVVLTLSYTVFLRRIPVFDIVAIAGGFVLRALAGGVAAPVGLSRWFVMVVTAVAFFIATGKRQAELARISGGEEGNAARRVIRHYSVGGLRLLLGGSAGWALFAYYVWAFQMTDVDGVPWRLMTAVPFTACLLRYGALVRGGAGEAPEEMLLSDSILALSGFAWLVLFGLGVHAAAG